MRRILKTQDSNYVRLTELSLAISILKHKQPSEEYIFKHTYVWTNCHIISTRVEGLPASRDLWPVMMA